MAMSNADRQRRYIARLKEKASVTDENVTNEFTRLKAFAGQLERENATLKEKLAAVTNGSVTDEVTRLKSENEALKDFNVRRTNEVERLKASNNMLKEKLADAERRAELKLDSWFAPAGTMTAAQFATIMKCLHPDTVYRLHDEEATKRSNEAFKIFNGLKSQLVR